MNGLFIGLTSVDIIYASNKFLVENTKNKANTHIIDIGGPATNSAYTFATLGGNATLISLVGQNYMSKFIKEKLENYNINHIDLNHGLQKNPEISTINVNTENGSRTVVMGKPLENISFSVPEIDLEQFDVICCDGFYAKYLLKVLQKNNKEIPVVFDGGSYKKYFEILINYITYPIFSENFTLPNQKDLNTFLIEKNVQTFAITKGEKPINVYDQGKKLDLPVIKLDPVNTLGAGDVFHGAFAKYIIENDFDFKSSLEMASVIASLSCKLLNLRELPEVISKL
jgi:sugar/nucleoside kinase (ribokinase family)